MSRLSDRWRRRNQDDPVPHNAFVLSGGAAMGALQVGMLRALLERRIIPDLVLGCSVGAINGVMVAGEPTLSTVGRMQDIWMDLVARDLLPTGLLPSTVQLLRKGEAIGSHDGVRALLDDILPAADFEDLPVRFQCAATNIESATEHWFSSGSLADPILASCSIPAVFPTVEIDGIQYFDGAVVNDVPVQRAVELGARRIFVLQVGGVDRPRPDARRPLDMAMLAYWVARRHRLLEDLARIPTDVEVVILPHGDPRQVRYNDLSRSAQLMDSAYRASSQHLDALEQGLRPRVYGPVFADDLGRPVEVDANAEEEQIADAHQLYAAAEQVLDQEDGATPDLRRRLGDRAEAIGPAMRALVERIRERGGSPFNRHDADEPEVVDD